MEALVGRDRRSQTAPQMLTAPGERRIVGNGEVETHDPEQRVDASPTRPLCAVKRASMPAARAAAVKRRVLTLANSRRMAAAAVMYMPVAA